MGTQVDKCGAHGKYEKNFFYHKVFTVMLYVDL